MINEFKSTVCGIPCTVLVTSYIPYDPGRTYGPPEQCYPPEGGEMEFELYDRKGYRAKWLEQKLENLSWEEYDIEYARLFEEYEKLVKDYCDEC